MRVPLSRRGNDFDFASVDVNLFDVCAVRRGELGDPMGDALERLFKVGRFVQELRDANETRWLVWAIWRERYVLTGGGAGAEGTARGRVGRLQ